MKPKSRKAKGRKLQNWVRDKLLTVFESDLTKEDIKPAIMGESGEDIKLSPKARELIPFSIEIKNQEAVNLWEAYAQASQYKYEPLVVIKRNKHKPLIIMDAEIFFCIIKE